MARQSTDEQT